MEIGVNDDPELGIQSLSCSPPGENETIVVLPAGEGEHWNFKIARNFEICPFVSSPLSSDQISLVNDSL